MACSICCEEFNRSTRRPIACPYCSGDGGSASSCTSCVQRYLLTVDDPECMSCRRPWTPDAIDASDLPRAFVRGELKRHRERVLLERERALLPATQEAVRREQRLMAAREEVVRLKRMLLDASRRVARIRWDREGPDGADGADGAEAAVHERRVFVKPCPAEGCRGFLTTAYRCGLCDARVCPTCHERLRAPRPAADAQEQEAHVCDPEAVETVRAIRRDCKPCPKCGAMIHRIEGCNQMFCTAPGCNTPFHWNTLKVIDAAHAHNPHLFEYRRRMALLDGAAAEASPEQRPCDGGGPMPSVRDMAVAISVQSKITVERDELLVLMRFVTHLTDYVLRGRFPEAPDVIRPEANEDLRKRFLTNEIDEAKLSVLLQAREKARRKRDAVHQILRTFTVVVGDQLADVVRTCRDARSSHRCGKQCGQEDDDACPVNRVCRAAVVQAFDIAVYSNEALAAVAKRYACTLPRIYRLDFGAVWSLTNAR